MSTTISTATLREPGTGSLLSSRFLLRVAGLPFETVDQLSLTQSVEWAHAVMGVEAQLEELREGVTAVLHEAVRLHADDRKLQRALISIRRDVFNGRAPKGEKAANIVASVPALLDSGLGEWLEQVRRRDTLLADGQKIFELEVEKRRANLKAAIQEPSFRKGLLVASPTLERDLDHYLKAPNIKLNRRLRLVERAALLYLLRTACKTSPFSTMGVVASGRVSTDSPNTDAVTDFQVASLEQKSFVRLNVGILSRLSMLLLSNQEIQRDLPLRLKDGWEIYGDRVRYLRRSINISNYEGPQLMDTVKESIFHLPLSPTLRRLIEFLGQAGECKLSELTGKLKSLDHDAGDELQIEDFLFHLLRLDLLVVPGLRLSVAEPDFLTKYRLRLATIDNELTRAAATHLHEIELFVASYPDESVAGRREILAGVERELKSCYRILGGDEEEVPRTLLYEDATISLPRLDISVAKWGDRFAGLREIQKLLPIFDMTVGPRLVMNAFFKTIYGVGQRCDDVLSFTEVFTQDYYDQYRRAIMRKAQTDDDGTLLPSLNHFNIPEINALDELRQDLASYIGEELAMTPAGSHEMQLSPEAVNALGARIPPSVSRLASHSFFSQMAETEDGPRLVVNRVYSGMTQMFSRFVYPLENSGDDRIAADLRENLEQLQPPGTIFAELQGASDTNLNLHPIVTRYEIICPGDRSSRPLAEQIPLSDLYIQHDSESNTLHLRSRRLQKEIIPLYLGFLLPSALPQLRQVLINFSCTSFATPYFWIGVKGGPKVGNTIAFYPRIGYGDVILQRAIWKMTPDYLPKRAPQESDADYFLAMTRWQKQNGLPRRVFVTPDSLSPRGEQSPEAIGGAEKKTENPLLEQPLEAIAEPELKKENSADEQPPEATEETEKKKENPRDNDADQLIRKPMYLDFENSFNVLLLERVLTRSKSRLVMTEMLPGKDDLWLRHGGQSYVTEFILELSRSDEGHTHE